MNPTSNPAHPITVAFHVPHLNAGGIERVVLNLLLNLNRDLVQPVLILGERSGSLLERVPEDVPILDLGGLPARKAIFALASKVKDTGAQILYSGTNAANITALLAGERLRRKVQVVPSEHTSPGVFLPISRHPKLRSAVMRLLYPRAACISVPLAAVGDELKAMLKLPKLKILVQPNPVLDAHFDKLLAQEPEIPLPPAGIPLITATGRLDEAKGFDDLLRAMAQLPELNPRPQLIIMGEGAERGALENLIKELKLETRVTLAGNVANPYAVMKHASLAVMSSRREGFGNVLIEAMACGAPVVSTDCPVGPRVILEQGKYGKLVPVGDPQAMATAMAQVITDRELAQQMVQAGQKRAQDYGINQTVGVFEKQFAALAAGQPWPAPTTAGDTNPQG